MRARKLAELVVLLSCVACAPARREPAPDPAPPKVAPQLPLKAASASGLMYACQAAAQMLTQSEDYAEPVVDAEASRVLAATLRAHDVRDDAGFKRAVDLFYQSRGDDYDFLYLYVADDGGGTYGLHLPIQAYHLPTLGMFSRGEAELAAEHPRLRSVILMKLLEDGDSGPTLHELAHYWANGLGLWPELGFPIDRHWGGTGVGDQLGGFRTDRLKCREPQDASPPDCKVGPDGRYDVNMPAYGTIANGGNNVPYAPLELYLMGLLPASEVPPIAQLVDPKRLNAESSLVDGLYSVASVRYVSAEQISAATGGPPPERLDKDGPLRVAFALVSPTADPQHLAQVALNARRFAAVELSPTYSWCTATGGRSLIRADL